MLELSENGLSIWRSLRPGSMGTVLWALQKDRQALIEFKKALESVDSPSQFSRSLLPSARAAANAVGQLALHQLAADAATEPHIEPRDSRWSLFRALSENVVPELCESIAGYPKFNLHARQALSQTVDHIRKTPGDGGEERQDEQLSELLREFLVYFGVGIGEILQRRNEDFVELVGAVAKLNQDVESPLYRFAKTGKRPGKTDKEL